MKNLEKLSGDFQVVQGVRTEVPYFLMDFHLGKYDEGLTFKWVKKSKVRALLKVVIQEDGRAVSLPGLPFGGIWVSGKIHPEELRLFLVKIREELISRKCCCLELVQPPKPYEPAGDLIENLFFKMGFTLLSIQSHQFFLGKKKIKQEVKESHAKHKRLLDAYGLTVKKGPVSNFGFLDQISRWNEEKGYMTLFDEKRLIHQVSEFPERYFLISLEKNEQVLGHALAVKLVPDSLYYYLSAIHPNAHFPNGGDILVQSLFQLAAEQKSDLIDLGTSEVNSQINESLMFFKSRFSNDMSNKTTWEWRF